MRNFTARSPGRHSDFSSDEGLYFFLRALEHFLSAASSAQTPLCNIGSVSEEACGEERTAKRDTTTNTTTTTTNTTFEQRVHVVQSVTEVAADDATACERDEFTPSAKHDA